MSRRYLARAGLAVRMASTPGEVIAALASRHADLFVIDLTMPGLEVPGVRRAMTHEVPVVFLLDRFGIRPRGLADRGQADGARVRAWLARPFSPRALVDAATGLLRCAASRRGGTREPAGDLALRMDPGRRRVTVAGHDIPLTRTEFALLAALAKEPGRPLGRQQLLAALEGDRGKRPTARAVDVYVTQLRAKLGPAMIETVHGIGYRLLDDRGVLRGNDPPADPRAPAAP